MNLHNYDLRLIDEIKTYENNARMHPKSQMKTLAASIKAHGFINPILIDSNDQVIAGHARLTAAEELGYSEIPCLQVEHLTNEQVRAYRLADNKIAEGSTWDENLLKVELEFLTKSDISIETTGFSVPEADIIIGNTAISPEPEMVPVELLTPPINPVTQSGDIWSLGPHKIGTGDLRDEPFVKTLVDDERMNMVFTDPPYNEKVNNIGGLGKFQHPDFVMASGEMSEVDFSAYCLGGLS